MKKVKFSNQNFRNNYIADTNNNQIHKNHQDNTLRKACNQQHNADQIQISTSQNSSKKILDYNHSDSKYKDIKTNIKTNLTRKQPLKQQQVSKRLTICLASFVSSISCLCPFSSLHLNDTFSNSLLFVETNLLLFKTTLLSLLLSLTIIIIIYFTLLKRHLQSSDSSSLCNCARILCKLVTCFALVSAISNLNLILFVPKFSYSQRQPTVTFDCNANTVMIDNCYQQFAPLGTKLSFESYLKLFFSLEDVLIDVNKGKKKIEYHKNDNDDMREGKEQMNSNISFTFPDIHNKLTNMDEFMSSENKDKFVDSMQCANSFSQQSISDSMKLLKFNSEQSVDNNRVPTRFLLNKCSLFCDKRTHEAKQFNDDIHIVDSDKQSNQKDNISSFNQILTSSTEAKRHQISIKICFAGEHNTGNNFKQFCVTNLINNNNEENEKLTNKDIQNQNKQLSRQQVDDILISGSLSTHQANNSSHINEKDNQNDQSFVSYDKASYLSETKSPASSYLAAVKSQMTHIVEPTISFESHFKDITNDRYYNHEDINIQEEQKRNFAYDIQESQRCSLRPIPPYVVNNKPYSSIRCSLAEDYTFGSEVSSENIYLRKAHMSHQNEPSVSSSAMSSRCNIQCKVNILYQVRIEEDDKLNREGNLRFKQSNNVNGQNLSHLHYYLPLRSCLIISRGNKLTTIRKYFYSRLLMDCSMLITGLLLLELLLVECLELKKSMESRARLLALLLPFLIFPFCISLAMQLYEANLGSEGYVLFKSSSKSSVIASSIMTPGVNASSVCRNNFIPIKIKNLIYCKPNPELQAIKDIQHVTPASTSSHESKAANMSSHIIDKKKVVDEVEQFLIIDKHIIPFLMSSSFLFILALGSYSLVTPTPQSRVKFPIKRISSAEELGLTRKTDYSSKNSSIGRYNIPRKDVNQSYLPKSFVNFISLEQFSTPIYMLLLIYLGSQFDYWQFVCSDLLLNYVPYSSNQITSNQARIEQQVFTSSKSLLVPNIIRYTIPVSVILIVSITINYILASSRKGKLSTIKSLLLLKSKMASNNKNSKMSVLISKFRLSIIDFCLALSFFTYWLRLRVWSTSSPSTYLFSSLPPTVTLPASSAWSYSRSAAQVLLQVMDIFTFPQLYLIISGRFSQMITTNTATKRSKTRKRYAVNNMVVINCLLLLSFFGVGRLVTQLTHSIHLTYLVLTDNVRWYLQEFRLLQQRLLRSELKVQETSQANNTTNNIEAEFQKSVFFSPLPSEFESVVYSSKQKAAIDSWLCLVLSLILFTKWANAVFISWVNIKQNDVISKEGVGKKIKKADKVDIESGQDITDKQLEDDLKLLRQSSKFDDKVEKFPLKVYSRYETTDDTSGEQLLLPPPPAQFAPVNKHQTRKKEHQAKEDIKTISHNSDDQVTNLKGRTGSKVVGKKVEFLLPNDEKVDVVSIDSCSSKYLEDSIISPDFNGENYVNVTKNLPRLSNVKSDEKARFIPIKIDRNEGTRRSIGNKARLNKVEDEEEIFESKKTTSKQIKFSDEKNSEKREATLTTSISKRIARLVSPEPCETPDVYEFRNVDSESEVNSSTSGQVDNESL